MELVLRYENVLMELYYTETKEFNDVALRLFTKFAAVCVLKSNDLSCFKTYLSRFTRSNINSVDRQKLFRKNLLFMMMCHSPKRKRKKFKGSPNLYLNL